MDCKTVGSNACRALAGVVCALLVAAPATAQDTGAAPADTRAATVVQLRLVNEARSDRSNPATLVPSADPSEAWSTADFAMATLDASWSANGRLRFGGAAAIVGDTASGNVRLRVREGYARVSATDWMDVEGGKRILKWGTGYAFTPTGVLDPPRNPADPRDRLGINEGILYGGVHLFRGDTVLSIVGASPDTWRVSVPGAAHREVAARVRTLVRGFEVAFIASAADTTGPSAGANFTHVIGDSLEWHGEVLVHRPTSLPGLPPGLAPAAGGHREVSGLIGCQYTFNVGMNVVLEYYHDGNGLARDTWSRLAMAASAWKAAGASQDMGGVAPATVSPVVLPGLRHFAFLRAAPAAAEPKVLPEVIAIAGLEDGSLTLVPAVTWTAQLHVQVYARGTVLAGRGGSVAQAAQSKVGVQVGIAARF